MSCANGEHWNRDEMQANQLAATAHAPAQVKERLTAMRATNTS
jgi:hypothetical protein